MSVEIEGTNPLIIDQYSWPALACPDCDMHMVHMERVIVRGGNNTVEIEGDADVYRYPRGGGGRGSTVKLQCHCECGARFAVLFRFLKGNTFVERHLLGKAHSFDKLPELWRD